MNVVNIYTNNYKHLIAKKIEQQIIDSIHKTYMFQPLTPLTLEKMNNDIEAYTRRYISSMPLEYTSITFSLKE